MLKTGSSILLLATAGLSIAASAGLSVGVADEPLEARTVSIQVDNPDEQAFIRVFFDRQLIYEAKPSASPTTKGQMLPSLAGKFPIAARGRHVLSAEVVATNTKAQIEWGTGSAASPWIVIHYYPGRATPAESPFFSFALQRNAYKIK